MSSLKIKGSIWPRGPKVTLPNLTFTLSSATSTVTLKTYCHESEITIECEAPDMIVGDPESMGFVVGNARTLFDGALSLMAVKMGRAHRFIADSVSLEGGPDLNINVEYASLAGLLTAFTMDEFAATMSWVTRDMQALLVLQDLNSAMSEPFYTQVGCGRAVDGIRHAIAGPGGAPDGKKWPELNHALNTERSYVELIMSASKKGRHGQRLVGGGFDSNEVLRRTWILFNRFMEYRKRGNVPLTPPDFPLLVD